jgi:hypothetical protein
MDAADPHISRVDLLPEAFARARQRFPATVLLAAPGHAARIRAAILDPDHATPRLGDAARAWRGHPFRIRDDAGQPIVEAHEAIVTAMLTLHAAAVQDDQEGRLKKAKRPTGQDEGADLDAIIRAQPKEVNVRKAATMLGVSRDTVLAYIRAGLLKARDKAVPGSSRPVYAILLESVLALRNSYETQRPASDPRVPESKRRRGKRAKGAANGKYPHLGIEIHPAADA